MVVIPDPFLSLLQVLPFGVAFIGLYIILWKPLMDYLQAREQATAGARADAAHLVHDIEHKAAGLEQQLTAARGEIANERSAARARAAKIEAEMIAEARGRAEAHINKGIAELNAAKAVASAQVEGMSRTLAAQITESVLGRPVQG